MIWKQLQEIRKETPIIDICVVTYNRLSYLKKCIWSIIASTSIRFRIFVIDDNSNDGTKQWLLEMRERGLIHAINLNSEGMGTAKCFNSIIKATKGEWFVMCNDDMYFYRWWDLIGLKIIKERQDCGCVSFYDYTRLSKDQGVEEIEEDLLRVVRTGLGAIFLNRELYKKVGGFNLPEGRLMGFFATKFCNRLINSNLARNKIYVPVPHYALHMDNPHCNMNEREYLKKYGLHRQTHKHQGKFKG